MHSIDLSKLSIRTDLIIENKQNDNYEKILTEYENISVEEQFNKINDEYYTTISFDDITDKDNFKQVEKILIQELKKYTVKIPLKQEDTVLVVGLGNSKSTPDSLGPETVKNVLVTRYLFNLGDVDKSYQSVSSIAPEVTSTTGIETKDLIKSIVAITNAKLLIVIDALASSTINRVNKIIQITNTGIHPGSGVGNNRKELSKKTLNIPVIAIGVPTIVDAATIVADTFKYMQKQFSYKINNYNNKVNKLIPEEKQNYLKEDNKLSNKEKKEILGELGNLSEDEFKQLIYEVLSPINYNLMVTPTEINYIIEKLGLLIGNSINKTLHNNYNSTK